jgi:hypothetical protein
VKRTIFSRAVLYANGVQTTTGHDDGTVVASVEPETPTQRVPDESDWQFPSTAKERE